MDHATDRWAPQVLQDASEHDTDDSYAVSVRENNHTEAWSLLFIEYHDQENTDPDLGTNSYRLVVNPGQATSHGGVRECELIGDQLRLLLTEKAAQTLGMPVETRFRLKLPADQLQMLRNGLTRVLVSGNPDLIPTRLEMQP